MSVHEVAEVDRQPGLDEAPQTIADTSLDLNARSANRLFVQREMRRVQEVIRPTADYEIVRSGQDHRGAVFLLNKHSGSAEYVVQFRTDKWRWLPQTVTQCLVWNNALGTYSGGVTSWVFNDYLLPRFGAVLSDTQQTQDGRRFWGRRMVDALARGLTVAVVDTRERAVSIYNPTADESFEMWLDEQDTFGAADRYQHVRYLIYQAGTV